MHSMTCPSGIEKDLRGCNGANSGGFVRSLYKKAKTFLAVLLLVFLFNAVGMAGKAANPPPIGSNFRDCPTCPLMVVIPAGNFSMGSSLEEWNSEKMTLSGYADHVFQSAFLETQPKHLVIIPAPFALGVGDVTRSEFSEFLQRSDYHIDNGCTLSPGYRFQSQTGWAAPGFRQTDSDPVVCVNWNDAQAYVTWLNRVISPDNGDSNHGPYRLPSEAEWEYSARAGTQTTRWWGNLIGVENADCDGCGSRWDNVGTAPAGSFRLNPFGLSDILGNAFQWIADCWQGNYLGAPSDGSVLERQDCRRRVRRGGAWSSVTWLIRPEVRFIGDVESRVNETSFRVAKTLPSPAP